MQSTPNSFYLTVNIAHCVDALSDHLHNLGDEEEVLAVKTEATVLGQQLESQTASE